MLIICPKCFEKYEINTKQFDEETHIFQCSSCGKRFEERIRFDDEKNKNQQTIPPAYITEQPVLAPLSENDYISSNRATMNFSPQSSVVLPEEFTPVNDSGSSIGRKIVFTMMLLFVFGIAGLSAYVWLNKDILLEKYPEVKKAYELITTPAKPVQKNEAPVKDENQAGLDVQEIILTPIEQKMQENTKIVSDVSERILPMETQEVVLLEPTVSDDVILKKQSEQSAQSIEQPTVSDIAVQQPILEKQPEQSTHPVAQQTDNALAVVSEVPVPETVDALVEELKPAIPTLSNESSIKVETEPLVDDEIILEEIPLPVKVVPVEEPSIPEIGVSPADVQIRDVSFKYDQSSEEPRLYVQGVISNITERVIKMPPLQVRLFDSNNTLLGIKDLPYGEVQMPAKSDEFFFYELTEIPMGTVAKVEIVVKG